MKKIIMLLCWLTPALAFAQDKGIEFQAYENWQKVLDKAKQEKKIIFVDVYATWCTPCKKMDREVFANSKVGSFVNENFISIKLQIDQTKGDSDSIKAWYLDAEKLKNKYHIEALPTILFIDPNGSQILKNEGFQDTIAFLNTLKTAVNPSENYPKKITKYKAGLIQGDSLLALALQAKKYHDDTLANQIAKSYKTTVIDKSNPKVILNTKLMPFLYEFGELIHITNPISVYMYKYPEVTDSLLKNKGYSNGMINYLIAKDILSPVLMKDGKITEETPNWQALEDKVSKPYGVKTAQRLLLAYKAEWFRNKKDWSNYVKASIARQEIVGVDTSGMGKAGLNNLVYYVILKYSNDPVDLNKALEYMHIALQNREHDDGKLDTYANVLYKLGKKDKALITERRALSLAEQRKDLRSIKIYQETIEKMESNLPIPVE